MHFSGCLNEGILKIPGNKYIKKGIIKEIEKLINDTSNKYI